jgi:hypothetical protein
MIQPINPDCESVATFRTDECFHGPEGANSGKTRMRKQQNKFEVHVLHRRLVVAFAVRQDNSFRGMELVKRSNQRSEPLAQIENHWDDFWLERMVTIPNVGKLKSTAYAEPTESTPYESSTSRNVITPSSLWTSARFTTGQISICALLMRSSATCKAWSV